MKTKRVVRKLQLLNKPKDPRINAGYVSIKEYLLLSFALAALSGLHMVIFKAFSDRGMIETRIQLVINTLGLYVFFMAAVYMALIAVVRYVSWNRPMRKISEAAKKIAQGDFSVRIKPLRTDGKKDYVEVLFEDFNTMAEELESIEVMKTDFISNVSHEIKTPLSVIQSYAAALQDTGLPVEQRHEYIKTIIESSQKLSSLVSNILRLNKLEHQEIPGEVRPFDLSEQLRRCALCFEELWERKNISFYADLEEINVCYDESMLELVWNNLFSNAVKFTGPGGRIMVSAKALDTHAIVSVSDTGCGITGETQKRIFDKFYQGDTSHAQEGNGLGLALVKQVIAILDGTISVDSQPGQGSTFTVRLKI